MALYCEICDLHVSSELVMQSHVKGKKHMRFADQHRTQTQRAERSVYVRGFTSGTTCDHLRAYFNPYGNIESVYMEKEKGFYAFIEFSSRDSVAKVLKRNGNHFLHHRRLQVRQKQVKRSVLRRKRDGYKQVFRDAEQPIINHDELMNKLQKQDTVADQLVCLCHELELNAEDKEQRHSIQDGLQEIFQSYIPGCRIHQFGSSVNGFGIKGCDMDLFLDFNLDVENIKPKATGAQNETAALPYIKDIKSLRVARGRLNLESLCEASPYDRLRLVSRILVQSGICSEELVIIPAVRCPVVRFVHQESGLKCDLSINNRLALRNTRLLQLLVQHDPRLASLVYTIRYWAKLRLVAGNANTGPRLTNYTLTMLVIAFLQQVSPPAIPPLAQLTTPENLERVDVEGWDCSLPRDSDCIKPNENTQTVEQLLRAFFEYYAQFDFASQVVCVRTAVPEQVLAFQKQTLADEKLANFKFGPICVQDPFVLDHNTALNVNEKIRQLLQQELRDAAVKWMRPEFPVKSTIRPWGLKLFLSTQPAAPAPAHISATVTVPEAQTSTLKCLHAVGSYDYSFQVIFQPAKLKVTLFSECSGISQHKWLWGQLVSIIYHQMLVHILLYDCQPTKLIEMPVIASILELLEEVKGNDTQLLIDLIQQYKEGVLPGGTVSDASHNTPGLSSDVSTGKPSNGTQSPVTTGDEAVDGTRKKSTNGEVNQSINGDDGANHSANVDGVKNPSASGDGQEKLLASGRIDEESRVDTSLKNDVASTSGAVDSLPLPTLFNQNPRSRQESTCATHVAGQNSESSTTPRREACQKCTEMNCSCDICSNLENDHLSAHESSQANGSSSTLMPEVSQEHKDGNRSENGIQLNKSCSEGHLVDAAGTNVHPSDLEGVEGQMEVAGIHQDSCGPKRPATSPTVGIPSKKLKGGSECGGKSSDCDNNSVTSDCNKTQVPANSAIKMNGMKVDDKGNDSTCVMDVDDCGTNGCSSSLSPSGGNDSALTSGAMISSTEHDDVAVPCATKENNTPAEIVTKGDQSDITEKAEVEVSQSDVMKQSANEKSGDILLHLQCSTYYRMWAGRKKIRQQLRLSDGEENLSSIELERRITKSLREVEGMKNDDAFMDFETCLTYQELASQTVVIVHAQPTKGAKEFSAFYPFLKSFFTKLVDKTLYNV